MIEGPTERRQRTHAEKAPDRGGKPDAVANVLFAPELDRCMKAVGIPIRSVLAHPGYAGTNLQLSGPTGALNLFMLIGNRAVRGRGFF